MSAIGTEVDEDRPRKKVRKGTHSCWECRRRKVRCVFKRETDAVCAGCLARALKCHSQQHVDEDDIEISAPKSIPDRVGRLESLMETVIQRFNEDGFKPIDSSYGVLTPSSIGCSVHESAPVHSLFNNAVLDSQDVNEKPSEPYQRTTLEAVPARKGNPLSKREKVCRTLLALIPPQRHLEAVFAATKDWWSTWQKQYPGIYSDASSLAEFTSQATVETRPAVIANVLLCIALGMQQLPSDFDFSVIEPSCSAKDLVEQFTSTATSLITSDDELSASVEGLECLTLVAKIHFNNGKPHRAWLNFRRAMDIAEIIGLHRKSTRTKLRADGISLVRKKSVWWQIYQGDRLLSLLLGLSHSLPDAFCDLDLEEGISEATYIRQLAIIATRIIDRNQAVVGPSFAVTHEVDGEMQNLYKHMPQSWWAVPPDHIPSDPVPEDGPSLILRYSSQFWYFQVQMLLHLPFMLRSATEPQFEYSKNTCMRAAREMIRRFIFIKENTATAFRSCHMFEFQVFLAAVAIQLNILRNVATDNASTDARQIAVDEGMIDDLTHELTLRGEVSGIGEQAVEVLKTLKAFAKNGGSEGHRFRLTIPYFGTILVTRGSKIGSAESSATGEPPFIAANCAQLCPMTDVAQPLGSVPASIPPPDHSLDFPQVSFSSSQFPLSNGMEQEWSFLGNLDTPFDYSRLADLDGTWDWFMNDNFSSM